MENHTLAHSNTHPHTYIYTLTKSEDEKIYAPEDFIENKTKKLSTCKYWNESNVPALKI